MNKSISAITWSLPRQTEDKIAVIDSKEFFWFIAPQDYNPEKVISLAEKTKEWKKSRTDLAEFQSRKYKVFSILFSSKPSDLDMETIKWNKYIPAKIKVLTLETWKKALEIIEILK